MDTEFAVTIREARLHNPELYRAIVDQLERQIVAHFLKGADTYEERGDLFADWLAAQAVFFGRTFVRGHG